MSGIKEEYKPFHPRAAFRSDRKVKGGGVFKTMICFAMDTPRKTYAEVQVFLCISETTTCMNRLGDKQVDALPASRCSCGVRNTFSDRQEIVARFSPTFARKSMIPCLAWFKEKTKG